MRATRAFGLLGHVVGGELLRHASSIVPWLVADRADADCVPEHVHVAGHPCDTSGVRAVVRADAEVVAPGSRCRALAGGQRQVRRSGAQRCVGVHRDEYRPAYDAVSYTHLTLPTIYSV